MGRNDDRVNARAATIEGLPDIASSGARSGALEFMAWSCRWASAPAGL